MRKRLLKDIAKFIGVDRFQTLVTNGERSAREMFTVKRGVHFFDIFMFQPYTFQFNFFLSSTAEPRYVPTEYACFFILFLFYETAIKLKGRKALREKIKASSI